MVDSNWDFPVLLHICTEGELEQLRHDITNHRYPGRNEKLEAQLVKCVVQQCLQESGDDFYTKISIVDVEDITRRSAIRRSAIR